MILLELFWTFLKIGLFSFGGGYGIVAVIRQEVLAHGWLDDKRLSELIAVSESTPGPISVNLSTFVGSEQGGIIGSALATLGVVLPAFVIMLIIARAYEKYSKNKWVNAAFDGIKPVVTALILSTGFVLAVKSLLPELLNTGAFNLDYKACIIAAIILAGLIIYKYTANKSASPIAIIICSAVLGAVIY